MIQAAVAVGGARGARDRALLALHLRSGLTPQQIIRGYIHDEPRGVKAIDESGPGKHKKAIRLYIYPDEETETLYVLTVGGKGKSQGRDIKTCSEFVKGLLKERESLKGEC